MNEYIANPDLTAQFAHAGCGAAFVFILALLWLPLWAAVIVVLAFAFAKEYVEFRWGVWEPRTAWQESLRDFVFWTIGVVIALVVLVLR